MIFIIVFYWNSQFNDSAFLNLVNVLQLDFLSTDFLRETFLSTKVNIGACLSANSKRE